MNPVESSSLPMSLEENLKKALTELLMLSLLAQKEYYIGELTSDLKKESGGVLNIIFPYAAIYRLQQSGCIQDIGKRIAPDGRRRQYYQITDTGRVYLHRLLQIYASFTAGVAAVLSKGQNQQGASCG